MYTSGFLFVLGLFAVLQVPGTFGDLGVPIPLTQADKDEIIDKHNYYRANVDPPASNMVVMKWSDSAQATAQRWANMGIVGHSKALLRNIGGTICGENLYMSSHPKKWNVTIKAWYNERKNWKYGEGPIGNAVVGHFTQLVYYKSHQLGCAAAKIEGGIYKYFYVCHYCPQGNHDLGKPYNTGNNCAECPDSCQNKLCRDPCPYNDGYMNCPTFEPYCFVPFVSNWCPATCKCTTQIK